MLQFPTMTRTAFLTADSRPLPSAASAPAAHHPSRGSPADQAWDDAFVRVESYLRAHRIESRLLLNRLTTEIIEKARSLARERPDEPPVKLALQVTHAHMEVWFRAVLGKNDTTATDERIRAQGRLALVLADSSGRWSAHYFLSGETMPANLADAMRRCHVQSGPEVRLGNMPPAPLEFPFTDPDMPSWPALHRPVLYRAAALWLAIVGVMGAAWAASH